MLCYFLKNIHVNVKPSFFSLYFPLLSSIGITIHLVKEILRLIKIYKAGSGKNEKENVHKLGRILIELLQLMILSSVASFCVCTTVASFLDVCNYMEKNTLECFITRFGDNEQSHKGTSISKSSYKP